MKGVDRKPSAPGACHSFVVSCLMERVWSFAGSLCRPFARSCSAIGLADTGHCVGLKLLPVRRLKVFQAILLEWVKSMPWTVSSHHSLCFLSRQSVKSDAFAAASSPGSACRNS